MTGKHLTPDEAALAAAALRYSAHHHLISTPPWTDLATDERALADRLSAWADQHEPGHLTRVSGLHHTRVIQQTGRA